MDELLTACLCDVLKKAYSGDLSLSVSFTDSAEVLVLKERIKELEAAQADLQRKYNSCELSLGNTTVRFLRLIDWCRDQGYPVPKKLK